MTVNAMWSSDHGRSGALGNSLTTRRETAYIKAFVAAQHRPTPGSGGAEERLFDGVLVQYSPVIRRLPAEEARGSPRHGGEPLQADLLFAVEADPERSEMDTMECGSHFAEPG
jgi:hypothetical protein